LGKRALLINPPIYDVQYWPEWSQPHGLLKVGSYLKEQGYETRLVDCLFPNAKGRVHQKTISAVQLCSTVEIPYREYSLERRRLRPNERFKYAFGTNLEDLEQEICALSGLARVSSKGGERVWARDMLREDIFHPDEVWIASIMTYWWKSTVDVAALCKELFPSARIRIGGIYPTLAHTHLKEKLAERDLAFNTVLGCDLDLGDERDLIVRGEIPEASWQDLDLDLYFEPGNPDSRYYRGPRPGEHGYDAAVTDRRNFGPSYAILTTTRGCPFNCAYCAQHAYNLYDDERVKEAVWTEEGRLVKVRTREVEETLREIRDKFYRYGIRKFAFYEDNFLAKKDNLRAILQGIIDDPNLRGNVHLHAPEGVEVRLIDAELAQLMHEAGFERIYLPLENINADVIKSWNRSHSNVQMFERAVENCENAGFALRNMEINAFILFGTPGENIRDVVDSVIYASSRIGSVIPMLFTPVPGSALYDEYQDYITEMGFDLHHLNGKLLPFLKFNRRLNPELTAQDYLDLEGLMFRVNAQAVRGTFNLGGNSKVAKAFRDAVRTPP
jgi:radical SAM superfamily enzyme YgiQ (UPF0313 family)